MRNLKIIFTILMLITSSGVTNSFIDVAETTHYSTNLSTDFISALNDKSYLLNPIQTIDSTFQLDTIQCEARKMRRIRYKKYINQELNYTNATQYYAFSYIIRDSSKREIKLRHNTFQLNPHDRGNFNSDNELVGTNRSISAPVYEKYIGYKPTVQDMQQISYNVAVKIYEKKFWKKYMNGDSMKVHNPIILDIVFNAICSSAGSHHFKDVLYEMTGFKIPKWKLKWITLDEVKVFNELCSDINKEQEFYQRYWNIRNNYYNARSSKKGLKGLSKWIKDYDYNIYNKIS